MEQLDEHPYFFWEDGLWFAEHHIDGKQMCQSLWARGMDMQVARNIVIGARLGDNRYQECIRLIIGVSYDWKSTQNMPPKGEVNGKSKNFGSF